MFPIISPTRPAGWLAALLVFLCALSLRASDGPAPLLVAAPSDWPALPSANVAGARLATAGNASFLIGGFDGGPAPSSVLWVLPTGAPAWQKLALKTPVAGCAVASTGDAVIVAGGMGSSGPTAQVSRLEWNNGQLREEQLPALPSPRVGAGATVLKGVLYVFGGVSSPDAKEASSSLCALDLKHAGDGWRELAPLPAPGRVLPTLVAQYGIVLVIGGQEAQANGFAATPEVWAYLPAAIDGTIRTGWQRRADIPRAVAGAPALAVGPDQVLVIASQQPGLDRPAPLPSASSGQAPVLFYHAVTDAWANSGASVPGDALGISALPAVGAFVVPGPAASGGSTELRLHRNVRTLGWLDYVVIAIYFVFLVVIGGYFSRKQNSSDEFSLGSRKVVWWAAGISMFATGASAISFMAIPALAFATSLIWITPLLVYIPAYFIQAHLIFPLLRRMELTSTYEYLERRFNLALRLIASAQCIVLQTFGRASVVLVLPSIAISAVTGINLYVSVVLMGIITTVYTALGGFEAVIWTAVFQGVLKLIAPLAMIILAITYLPGGFHQFWSQGLAQHKFDLYLPTWNPVYPVLWGLIISNLMAATVQTAGDQPIIQRVFSAPMNEVRRVSAMSCFCSIVIGIIVNVMGVAIFAYFRAYPEQFDPLATNDQIVPLYTVQALPMGMAGVVVAAIFASAMATVASSMNSVATIFTEDFYLRWRPQTPDKVRLRMLKGISYLVGFIATLVALLLASLNLTSLMAIWTQLVSLLGGGVVGVYSLGMFTKRANGAGAIVGAIASIILTALVKFFTPLHWSLYSPLAILSCMLVGYFASFLFGPSTRDLTGLTVFTPAASAPKTAAEPLAVSVS
jgi:SSS family transporter